jgi:hypothetical protein
MAEGCFNRTALFMAAAIFLIGIGYLAILPPFEGFDEYAHYSSVRQIADTGTLPFYGRSFIDQNVERYIKDAPMPWGSLNPPFDRTGHMTYPAFFANAEAVAHYWDYRRIPADWIFAPGSIGNWEAQHPPLYYILMAPIMKMTEALSFVTQILILRLASYLMAFAGLMIGWRATRLQTLPDSVAGAYLFYPIVVPMFFGEFARIGNDSLCLLLLGVIYALSFRLVSCDGPDPKSSLAVGICFGLGLLTKALFIPVLAGYALFLALRMWLARGNVVQFRREIRALTLIVICALVIGGGWYIYDFFAYGSLIGSNDSINLEHQGGLIANFRRNFSLYEFARQMIAVLASWSWAGSWSLARMSPLVHLPILLLTGWVIVGYVGAARRYPFSDLIWLPAWLVVPFLAGLAYHVLVSIALGGAGTPGWYLNVLGPFLALAAGYGIERLNRSGAGRYALVVSLAYAGVFLLVAIWSQVALFSGCAIKSDQKYYQFAGHVFCLDHLASVTNHLSVIAWPGLALVSIGGGFFCLIAGLLSFFGGRDSSRYPDPPFGSGPRTVENSK